MKSFLVGSTWSYWRSDKELEIKYFRAQLAIATKRLLLGEKLINSKDKNGYHNSINKNLIPRDNNYSKRWLFTKQKVFQISKRSTLLVNVYVDS